ncbi:MAG: succinyldiaminopimelate transaminase [Chromatiales bacterium 21-64-14]|nr:MAG: succinyldiaminopimelate transaminase [Chromatiales bacterium 21-64-14]HQU15149.1 succinyldiaminopimelate transaminase [Gammaproteobacteria bacterium]
MNPDLSRLQPYPFERLAQLLAGAEPPAGLRPIALSIGEPQHAPPAAIAAQITAQIGGLARYPSTRGADTLRAAIAAWASRRYGLTPELDPACHVLPLNGTREGLFAFAQCVVDPGTRPLVLMPNPFYQIYEGAALLAGAEPWYINPAGSDADTPDFAAVPAAVWDRCQLLYLCSPGNPTGAVLDLPTLQGLIGLAQEHDFIIASDECYSEIYLDEARPPPGLLQAAAAFGIDDYRRCVAFHSLSKRSNVPGMRSGFVAGDPQILAQFLRYRTYHGASMAPPVQAASIAAWQDEEHVRRNRAAYREKFDTVLDILGGALDVRRPAAGFYLWPRTPVDDAVFTRALYERQHVTVLPGSYLSRVAYGENPGRGRVRIALVPPMDECVEAAHRIRGLLAAL